MTTISEHPAIQGPADLLFKKSPLTLDHPDIAALIDRKNELMARAAADAAQVRARQTADALEAARSKLDAAKRASYNADRGEGPLHPLDAQLAFEAAQREFAVAERVAAAAEQARVAAHRAIRAATGEDLKPAYLEVVRKRLRAAAKFNRAKRELVESVAAFRRADRLLENMGAMGVSAVVRAGEWHEPRELHEEIARLRFALSGASWLDDATKASLLAELEG